MTRRLVLLAAAVVAAVAVVAGIVVAVVRDGDPDASPAKPTFVTTAAVPGVLTGLRVSGRVERAATQWRLGWPGVAVEAHFRGTGVGATLEDGTVDYDLQVDGATVTTLRAPLTGTHWVKGLADGAHTVRLVRRGEGFPGTFGGFVAADGGALGPAPAARTRRVEFIGDSLTAGYGDEASSGSCADVKRLSNADAAYPAIAARALDAEHRVEAVSGIGVIHSLDPRLSTMPKVYGRTLSYLPGEEPPTWRPQVAVVWLGTNDFAGQPRADEPWITPDDVAAAFRRGYATFLAQLRSRYGPATQIVVASSDTARQRQIDGTRQAVADRTKAGDDAVRLWSFAGADLDFQGCDGHLSPHDNRLLAERLVTYLGGLGLAW